MDCVRPQQNYCSGSMFNNVGSKEYVPVVDLEKHFDSIDEKDACSA
jgi:hypothetical protein